MNYLPTKIAQKRHAKEPNWWIISWFKTLPKEKGLIPSTMISITRRRNWERSYGFKEGRVIIRKHNKSHQTHMQSGYMEAPAANLCPHQPERHKNVHDKRQIWIVFNAHMWGGVPIFFNPYQKVAALLEAVKNGGRSQEGTKRKIEGGWRGATKTYDWKGVALKKGVIISTKSEYQ